VTKLCIICNKVKDEKLFTDEHIIPLSLGNRNLIIKVCKQCNDKMGSTIDNGLVNNGLSKFYRYSNGIKGQSGKVPNPFATGGVTSLGKKFFIDGNGKPHYVPSKYEDAQKIIFRDDTEEKVKETFNKWRKRNGDVAISHSIIVKLCEKFPYEKEIEINCQEIEFAMIKIAYEFMYMEYGAEYLNDKIGKRLRKIIYEYAYNKNIIKDYKDFFIVEGDNIPLLIQYEVYVIIEFLKKVKEFKSYHFLSVCNYENTIAVIVYISTGKDKYFTYMIKTGELENSYFKGTQSYILLMPSGELIDFNSYLNNQTFHI